MDSSNGERTRAPREWEAVGQFTDGGYYVKVNRAKGTRSFSMEVGGIKTDGTTMRFVPLPWWNEGEAIFIDERFDPVKLVPLIAAAVEHMKETIRKDGVQQQRRR